MKILTIIAALFLLSCSKDKTKCWDCVARTPVLPDYDTTICRDERPTEVIQDKWGNDRQLFCQ